MFNISRDNNRTCKATPAQNEMIRTLPPEELLQNYAFRTAETMRFAVRAKSKEITRNLYTPTLQSTPVVQGLPSYQTHYTMATLTVALGGAIHSLAQLLPEWTISVSQVLESTIPSLVSKPTQVLTIEYKITDPAQLNQQRHSFDTPNTYTLRVQYYSHDDKPPVEEIIFFRHPKNEQLLASMQENIYEQSLCPFNGYNSFKRIQREKFKEAWGYMYVKHHAKTFPLFTYLNHQTPWEFKAFQSDIPQHISHNLKYPPTNIQIFDQHRVLQLMPISSVTMQSKFKFWSVRQQQNPISFDQQGDPGMTSHIRNFSSFARHEHLPTAYLNALLRAMLWDFHAWWTKVHPKLFSPGFFELSEVRKSMAEALTNEQHALSRIIYYSPPQHRLQHNNEHPVQVLYSATENFVLGLSTC